jgi:outer membrane protein insertion porin family/translocation and assembly module TamA
MLLLGCGTLAAQEVDGVRVVRKVSFRGNHSIDEKTLRAAIATSQAPFLYRLSLTRWLGLADAPVFDEMEFRRDVLRVQALYGVRGFPDAVVDTTMRRRDDDLDITFRITEGAPIVVDSVRIVGGGLDTLLDLADIRTILPLQQDAPFDRLAFQTSVSVLEALLRDRGHAFAKVTGGFEASPEDPPRSVTVTLTADPGPRATIREVLVEGTEDIDDRVVLKTLMIKEGQVFSDSVLHEGMINLQRTEMFRQVRVTLVDSVPSSRSDSLVTVAVRAELAEYPLRRARVSAGYGTLDCFRTMGSLDFFNFGGGGRRVELRARTSQLGVGQPADWGLERTTCRQLLAEDTSRLKLNYNFAVTLHDPLLSWEDVTGMATVYFERHTEFGAYLREAVGAEVALTRQIATDVPLRGAVAFAYGRTVASPATFCALLDVCVVEDQAIFGERRRRTVLDFELVRDRTNSVNDPSRGSALVTEFRWSPAFLGSDRMMRFLRLTAAYKEHHSLNLAGGRVFSWRLRAGTVFAPRTDLPGGGTREFVPPEERLFAGGSNSVRGFGQNLLGPVVHVLGPDSTIRTSATGGTFMAVGNAELRVPMRVFGLLLFGAVFVDAGLVTERAAIALDRVRVTPGVGVRMPSVLGPIRLDVGYNPHPPPAGPLYSLADNTLELVDPEFRPAWRFIDRLQVHLSIGQAF